MPEVVLPLNAPVSPNAANGNVSNANILVIDDEAGIRESLEVLLSLEGYSTTLAPDGAEGLRLLDVDNYDLVLLDLALPGQSGLELLPQIKERQPELPVIMITAYGDAETRRKAIEGGAAGLFTKPIDFPGLRDEIGRRLDEALGAS